MFCLERGEEDEWKLDNALQQHHFLSNKSLKCNDDNSVESLYEEYYIPGNLRLSISLRCSVGVTPSA